MDPSTTPRAARCCKLKDTLNSFYKAVFQAPPSNQQMTDLTSLVKYSQHHTQSLQRRPLLHPSTQPSLGSSVRASKKFWRQAFSLIKMKLLTIRPWICSNSWTTKKTKKSSNLKMCQLEVVRLNVRPPRKIKHNYEPVVKKTREPRT